MKVTWIGQAGLLFDDGKSKILIDPYLSDSVERVNPQSYRRVPVREELFEIMPDIMIFTHDHLDHYDPETAKVFLGDDRRTMTVLSPLSVWQKARQNGKQHNYVLFDRGNEWTEKGFRFCAVGAAHSDPFAIGVIIEALSENKVYYVAGDTLYNRRLLTELPRKIDVVFLPVNGVGNNMNPSDAERFFYECGAEKAIPYHIGMFDEITPEIFNVPNKLTLNVFEEQEI